MLKHQGKPTESPGDHDRLLGAEQLAEVVMVDQTPIGKTARSNPASYVGAFDAIRKLFAQATLSRERGYTAGTFSFNRSEEHTSELQSLMRISYAVFCLKQKTNTVKKSEHDCN